MTEIRTSDTCLDHLIERVAKQDGPATSRQVRDTAAELIRKCVGTYELFFGKGDVGEDGTAAVAKLYVPASIPEGTTGLLYGKVQSGKTMTSIASVAMAKANGFRVFVVLTSDNIWLGRQTVVRFRDALEHDGPVVVYWDEWRNDPKGFASDRVKDYIGDTGVVFVSTKNVHHLRNLAQVLKAAGAKRYPGMVLDDEADNASLNTAESTKARGAEDSRVFAEIGKIRKIVPNHIYVQVTATPQSLLLQNLDHPNRPAFSVISRPGETYIGGEIFFNPDSRLCLEIDPSEIHQLRHGRVTTRSRQLDIPEGLRKALCSFFIGSAHKRLTLGRDAVLSMLIHISHKRFDHQAVKGVVSGFARDLDQALRGKISVSKAREAEKYLKTAYEELAKTADLRPFAELLDELTNTLRNAVPEIIDADNPKDEPEYRRGMNILIGGNRLGRGVTIRGLFITYYARDAKQKMMDTVHQHARMFGYRQDLKDVTRFFVPLPILKDFRLIHDSDEAMRAAVGDDPTEMNVKPVLVGGTLKPTRSNVLDPAAINAIAPGLTIYPADPLWKRNDVAKHTVKLDRMLATFSDDEEYRRVQIAELIPILREMPSRYVQGYSWEDERVRSMLDVMAKHLNLTHAYLNVRRGARGEGLGLVRQDAPWSGFADGRWIARGKQLDDTVPTLIVMKQKGARADRWDNEPVYVPTLLLPKGRFAFLYNYSE